AQTLKASLAFPAGSLFPTLTLHESPKAEVLRYRPGMPFRREAFAVIFDRAHNRTFEAVVDLRAGQVISWKTVPG
ncbi:MAG: tyramine oxidase, partial [Chloroflexota bacterium]